MDQRLLRRRRARKKHKTGLTKLLQEFRPNFKSCAGQLQLLALPLLAIFKDSARVFKRCTKTYRHDIRRTVWAIILGLFIMGVLGIIIKLLHILTH